MDIKCDQCFVCTKGDDICTYGKWNLVCWWCVAQALRDNDE